MMPTRTTRHSSVDGTGSERASGRVGEAPGHGTTPAGKRRHRSIGRRRNAEQGRRMARSLRILFLGVLISTCSAALPLGSSPTLAAKLDEKGKSDAMEALRFYKEGNYEDAAKLFVRLSIAYPDMLVFVRNLGACYYYLRRYDPALSSLRDYLHRKTDV